MTDPANKLDGIYRYTSIARPVDPAFPTNRALLLVLPALALVNTALAIAGMIALSPLPAALSAALVGFASWALTRELAPDDDMAAFVALAFAWLSSLFFQSTSVLLLFAALFLVRIVNRSTGLAARPLDTVMVLGLVIWSAYSLQQPLILVVAALAFSLDAFLRDGLTLHIVAAGLSVAAFGWLVLIEQMMVLTGIGDLELADGLVLGAIFASLLIVIRHSDDPASVCDVSSDRLDRGRVDAGLLIGFLAALQALLTQGDGAWFASPIWACIFAVPFASAIHAAREHLPAVR